MLQSLYRLQTTVQQNPKIPLLRDVVILQQSLVSVTDSQCSVEKKQSLSLAIRCIRIQRKTYVCTYQIERIHFIHDSYSHITTHHHTRSVWESIVQYELHCTHLYRTGTCTQQFIGFISSSTSEICACYAKRLSHIHQCLIEKSNYGKDYRPLPLYCCYYYRGWTGTVYVQHTLYTTVHCTVSLLYS